MNIFDLTGKERGKELVSELFAAEGVRIERIVSTGEVTGWYDQSDDEWVLLMAGNAELEIEENGVRRSVLLKKGDTLFLAAHQRHRVTRTSSNPPCIWLCVFMRPPQP